MPTDFIPTSTVKAASRTFTAPIVSAETFDSIISTLTGDTNPLGASGYQTAGSTLPGAAVTEQTYKATIEYIEETEGKTVGSIVITAPTRASITAAAAHLIADTTLAGETCFNGDAVQNTTKNSWNARIRIHDPTGEIYYLTLTRKTLKLTSYENDTILTKVETWADSVPALN